MSTAELADRIAALSATGRAQVERFVDRLFNDAGPIAVSSDLVDRAEAIQERIFKKHGFLGKVSDDIRRLRENGR